MTVDLNRLSPAALSAAMRGGTEGWGQCASATGHVRYCEAIVGRKGRRRCRCGCGRASTHRGMANGVAMMVGCELHVRRWVRNPEDIYRQARERRANG